MWKNKHLIVAMIVAPILAIIAYFGVDSMVSEKPHAAQSGTSYPLRVMSNCRYASGECELRNGEVKLRLILSENDDWLLESELPLTGGVISSASDAQPMALVADDTTRRWWRVAADRDAVARDEALRIVIGVGGSQYFAEVPVIFVEAETTLER